MLKKGFTLAEVLITLSIIGVVAALTVPTLVRNYQEHAWRQQWKKTFSAFAQATKMLEAQNGSVCAQVCDADGANCATASGCTQAIFRNEYASVLKCVKVAVNVQNIFSSSYNNYKSTSGAAFTINNGNWSTLVLADGTSIYFYNPVGRVLVDVNGQKPPNELGKDFFCAGCKKHKRQI